MKRATRRHHARRKLAKSMARSSTLFRQATWRDTDATEIRAHAVRNAHNAAKCSCAACGNPRRHFGHLTVQERRAHVNPAVELADWRENEGRPGWVRYRDSGI